MQPNLNKIILTGASGFIGKHILMALREEFNVIAIARRSMGEAGVPFHKNVQWIQWDIADRRKLKEIIGVIKDWGGADYCIHLAGYYDFDYDEKDEYERVNVMGTKNVLDLCRQFNIKRFIFASSLAACNFPEEGKRITERTGADATFAYARSKKAGEDMCREYSIWFPCSIVRLAAVFSDWCEYGPLFRFYETWLSTSWRSRILGGKGDSSVSYIHVLDLVRLIQQILELSKVLLPYDIYNASPNGSSTHLELFKAATLEHYGHAKQAICLPAPISASGLLVLNFLGSLRIIAPPFEKPWMVSYIDKQLNIDSTYTQRVLQWNPRERYSIERRMLYLLINRKTHPNEWKLKNEIMLERRSSRPNLMLYETLLKNQDIVLNNINTRMCDKANSFKFPNYQKMDIKEFRYYTSNLYHLILASIRSGDRALIFRYMDQLAMERFAAGFTLEEIVAAIQVFKEEISNFLLRVLDGKTKEQLIFDYVEKNMNVAQDKIEEAYEEISNRIQMTEVSRMKLAQEQNLKKKLIQELSAFYQQFPSG